MNRAAQVRVTKDEARRLGVPERDLHGIKGRSHWNASPTIVDGIRFASKTEARVYRRLKAELNAGERLYCHVAMPLWSLAPRSNGRPHTLNVDFILVRPQEGIGVWRAVDAKPTGRRRSRDWARGAAAFEASYGIRIDEASE